MARVNEFCVCIEGQRESLDQINDENVQNWVVQRAHGDSCSRYTKLHDDILDNILNQVQNRFKDHEKLTSVSFLDPQQFISFKTTFFETAFSSLRDKYRPHLEPQNPSDLLLFLCKGLWQHASAVCTNMFSCNDPCHHCIHWKDIFCP